jgi:hypothetical protein
MKSQEFKNFIQGEIDNWQAIVTATGPRPNNPVLIWPPGPGGGAGK